MKEIKDWLAEEKNALTWKAIINSPLSQLALEVARNHALPRAVKVETDNADTIVLHTALAQATQTGWHQCLDFLEKVLTSKPAPKKDNLPLRTLKPTQDDALTI